MCQMSSKRTPFGLISSLDNGPAGLNRSHIAERHDLKHDRRAVIGGVAAQPDESLLHARNIRNKLFGPRIVDILSETRRDLNIARAEDLGDRKDLGGIRRISCAARRRDTNRQGIPAPNI